MAQLLDPSFLHRVLPSHQAVPLARAFAHDPNDTGHTESPHTALAAAKLPPSASSASGCSQAAAQVHASELPADCDNSVRVPNELPPGYVSAFLAEVLLQGPQLVLVAARGRLAVLHGSAAFVW